MMKGLFVGLTTVDALYLLDAFPDPNRKTVASRYGLFAGGPATNAAITFALLGGAATLVSAVGMGALGAIVRSELAGAGVALADCAPSPDFAPVLSSVFSVAAAGTRNVVTAHAAVPSMPTRDIDAALNCPIDLTESTQGVDVLLLDGHNLLWALPAARAARKRGIPVVLDGGSWKTGLEGLLPFVDVAICSEDFRLPEATAATTDTPFDTIRGLRERGIACTAVSRGEKPVVFATADSISDEISVPDCAVVDTLGAGDVLHGAFAFFYAQSRDFASSLEQAAQVASLSCGFFGPREGVLRGRNGGIRQIEAPRLDG